MRSREPKRSRGRRRSRGPTKPQGRQPHVAEGAASRGHFFSLLPDRVLDAVEESGHRVTGRCLARNSLENRVYDVELENDSRVIAKFYRPGRWSRETILDEHRLLLALDEHEIPTCPPLAFPGGGTLRRTPEGIFFALFPRRGGRSPQELTPEELRELGRLVARIHNVSASLGLRHRPELSPATYGLEALAVLLRHPGLRENVAARLDDAVRRLVAVAEPRFRGVERFVIHADCHRGNLLWGSQGWFFLDFDDMAVAPPVQDLWLLLSARPRDCPREVDAFLEGYETFRSFDAATLGLIEVLRGLRYVRYAAWIAARWEDPSFPRRYPTWGTDRYWQELIADLHEQVARACEAEG